MIDIVVDENIRQLIIIISWSLICFLVGLGVGMLYDIIVFDKITRDVTEDIKERARKESEELF